ncbi:phospholipase A1-like [Arctopsyche grandis]|uniref:phospholipase A1-like n=1 Tax=Arctopsyche grandis TaxID=121162 RepID=UPI00406D95F5
MAKLKLIFVLLFTLLNLAKTNILTNIFGTGPDPQVFEGPLTIFKAYIDRNNDYRDIHLRFYTGKTLNEYYDIKLSEFTKLLTHEKFRVENPIVLYIHGYKENTNMESVQTVVGAYLKWQPETNVIVVDWSNMAVGSYIVNAAPNTKKVASAVTNEILKLIEGGVNSNNIHIVGHSLGGQTAGFIGKALQKSNIKLKRITGLDPAFPLFYPGLVMEHIDKNDAEFVDIIHTDAGFYGAPMVTGTIDFWPNNGARFQPGCKAGVFQPLTPEDLCSHWRSWHYWAESLGNPTAFPSYKAINYDNYLKKLSSGFDTPVVYMGIAADKNASGNYYLSTNDASPFGKGRVQNN